MENEEISNATLDARLKSLEYRMKKHDVRTDILEKDIKNIKDTEATRHIEITKLSTELKERSDFQKETMEKMDKNIEGLIDQLKEVTKEIGENNRLTEKRFFNMENDIKSIKKPQYKNAITPTNDKINGSDEDIEVNKKEIATITTVIFVVIQAIAKIIAPNFFK